MASPLKNMSSTAKGIILIVLGAVLTLYAFGFLQTQLNLILVIVGVAMVVYGFMTLNYHQKIMQMIEDSKKKKR
jgi:uncharacterized membrane protein